MDSALRDAHTLTGAEPGLTASSDAAAFLAAASEGAAVDTHAQLWLWLRGEVQVLLPHELLLVAWGDFSVSDLQIDLVSDLPSLRTRDCPPRRLAPLVSYLHDCWSAAQHVPCAVSVDGCAELLGTAGGGWEPNHPLRRLRSAAVHGLRDARTGGARLYAALREDGAPASPAALESLRLLTPFIDTALRRMAPSPQRLPHGPRHPQLVPALGVLSERERQIMAWVALGKTNPEIGSILRISEFTVKNHMKSIFCKLDVSNRAQAVAKLGKLAAYA